MKLIAISHAGVRQVNRAVFRCLQEMGFDVSLVIPAKIVLASGMVIEGESKHTDDPALFPLPLIGSNPRTYYYNGLLETIERLKPDVILLENDPVSELGWQLARWCKKHQAIFICQTYDNVQRDLMTTIRHQSIKRLPMNLLIQASNRLLRNIVDAILVVNRESEDLFRAYRYRRVERIPLGYDEKIFFPDVDKRREYRRKIGVGEDVVLISYFGRLIEEKGVHILLDALRELKDLNWLLLIDDKHDQKNEYRSMIRKRIDEYSLSSRVRYFSADHVEIADYMRASDIGVAPSITTPTFKEQYGRTVQEVMACGCVSVVSDAGNLPDLLGNNELVFKERDSAALREILSKLIADSNYRSQLTNSSIMRASTELTARRQAAKVARVVDEINQGRTNLPAHAKSS